jgi:hypothetical protein
LAAGEVIIGPIFKFKGFKGTTVSFFGFNVSDFFAGLAIKTSYESRSEFPSVLFLSRMDQVPVLFSSQSKV